MRFRLIFMAAVLVGSSPAMADEQTITGSLGRPSENKKPHDSLDGPPIVSAKAWVIGDGKTGEVLWGNNVSASRPMASTTKIMTAWIVLELADDAADDSSADDSLKMFVEEMNRRAKDLGMQETRYLDPHGNSANRSSARDLLRLACKCMENEMFRSYVQTRRHRCTVTAPAGGQREATWKNTNQLLDIGGFDGIKTGTTGGAGACLVSSGHRGDDHLIVVVLGSTSKDGRYVDSRNLYRWAWTKRGHK